MRVHASVHVNMSVYGYNGTDWDSGMKTCGESRLTCFTPFYMLTVHNIHGLLNSQFAHVNFVTAQ